VAAVPVPSTVLDSELPGQIVQAIRVQVDNGTSEARLRLNPGFLGNVSIAIRIEGESVVASLQASDPQVREWMRTNEQALRQSLADQGLQLEQLVIVEEEQAASDEEHADTRRQQDQEQQTPRRRRPSADSTFEFVL